MHSSISIDVSNLSPKEAFKRMKLAEADANGLITRGSGTHESKFAPGSILELRTAPSEKGVSGQLLSSEKIAQARHAREAAIRGIAEGKVISEKLGTELTDIEQVNHAIKAASHPDVTAYAVGASTGDAREVVISNQPQIIGGEAPKKFALPKRNIETLSDVQVKSFEPKSDRNDASFQVSYLVMPTSAVNLSGSKATRITERIVIPSTYLDTVLISLAAALHSTATVTFSSKKSISSYRSGNAGLTHVLEKIEFNQESQLHLVEEVEILLKGLKTELQGNAQGEPPFQYSFAASKNAQQDLGGRIEGQEAFDSANKM